MASRQYSAKLEMFRQLRIQSHPHEVTPGGNSSVMSKAELWSPISDRHPIVFIVYDD